MSRRGWLLLLLAILTAHVVWLSCGLVVPDLARDYPHQASDSCDWLGNGLHRAGFPTRDTVRPPLFPWLLALATGWNMLPFVPVFLQGVMAAGALLLFWVLVRRHEGAIAFGVALAFFLGHRYQSLGLDLMADHLAAVLLFASLVAFRRSADDPRLYLLAGIFGGLSSVTQQAALLLPVPFGLALWLHRREDLRRPWTGAGVLAFVTPAAVWFVHKGLAYGRFGDVTTKHWGLLGLNGKGPGFYLGASLVFFGVVAWLLAWIGGWRLLLRKNRDPQDLVFPATIATLLVFFVFVYTWNSERFLLFLYLPVGILVAAGIELVGHRAWRGAMLILVVVSMAWPWHLAPRRALEATAQMKVWRSHESLDARDSRAAEPLLAGLQASRDSREHAVFLHRSGRPRQDRFRLSCRLGNVLRRRVSYVPGIWWTEGAAAAGLGSAVSEAGTVLGFEARWLHPPGDDEEPVLLVFDSGVTWDAQPGDSGAEVWRRALEVRNALPGPDSMVALFPCPDGESEQEGAARALAAALGTPSLFVATGAERDGLRQLIDSGEQGAWQIAGGHSLRSVSAGGWRGWEIQTHCR